MEEEIWKTIPGFGEWYQASNYGRIRSLRYGKERVMRPHFDRKGYGRTVLHSGDGRWSEVKGESKCVFVHKAVWLAFCGEIPAGFELDHIDHNPRNNRLDNLQLLTRQENMQKAWANIRSSGREWNRRKKVAA